MTTPETVTEPYWMGDMGGRSRLRDEFALRLTGEYSRWHGDSLQEIDERIKHIFAIADKLATEAHERIKT